MTTPPEPVMDPAKSAKLAGQAKVALWCGIFALVFFLLIWVTGLVSGLHRQAGPHNGVSEVQMICGFAIIICGSLSLVLSILAVVFGALGRHPGNVTHRGVATAGLVLGCVTLGLGLCFLAVVVLVMVFTFRAVQHH